MQTNSLNLKGWTFPSSKVFISIPSIGLKIIIGLDRIAKKRTVSVGTKDFLMSKSLMRFDDNNNYYDFDKWYNVTYAGTYVEITASNKILVYEKECIVQWTHILVLRKVSFKGLWATCVQSMIYCYTRLFYLWTIRVQYLFETR